MHKQIQFILTTPDELTRTIIDAIDTRLREFEKELTKTPTIEYLTRIEVSKLLKKDLSTIHLWTKKGTLVAYYIEGSVFYKRSQIEEVMTSLVTKSDTH
ncbi:hypothetical protein AAU57_14045 [Nonlabens sp. YIK11]|nr:hypothetical protein AAU57_14045 [Nonlabens sp. YIK11]